MILAEGRATASSGSQFRMLWSVLAFTAEQNVGFLGQRTHSLIRSAHVG
jgi:hypothetical protein